MADSRKLVFRKFVFSLLGLAGLVYVIRDYGVFRLQEDINLLGWWSVAIVLTFFPTLVGYSTAWLLCTEFGGRTESCFFRLARFTGMSAASIAWNNLTPFLKIGGEPAKVFMLESLTGRREAVRSVVIYNIVHVLGTLLALIIAAFVIPPVFGTQGRIGAACYFIGVLGLLIFILMMLLPRIAGGWFKRSSLRKWRKPIVMARWTLHRCARFARRRRLRFVVALSVEVAARFVEGFTFWLAFRLLGQPISIVAAAFLDVGRLLFDTVFFFIPYQVGSREGGVLFLLRDVMGIGTAGYLAAAFMYRFVEIAWIGLGWLYWVAIKRRPVS
jgi:hypothetical protein